MTNGEKKRELGEKSQTRVKKARGGFKRQVRIVTGDGCEREWWMQSGGRVNGGCRVEVELIIGVHRPAITCHSTGRFCCTELDKFSVLIAGGLYTAR